ncbi:hypothetical protein Bhyg_06983, partial [Pseudolycoriella hygida]
MLPLKGALAVLDIIHDILIIPRRIYEDLVENRINKEFHALQNVSLCGRKVLTWSEKISLNDVEKICVHRKMTPNEVLLCAASAALYTYMEKLNGPVPDNLDACARYIGKDDLIGNTNYVKNITGFSFLNLPLGPYSKEQVAKIRIACNGLRPNRFIYYIIYMAQRKLNVFKLVPHCFTKLLFRYLSKQYNVSITKFADVDSSISHSEICKTIWGDKIKNIIFFVPPQSNISVSIAFQRYGKHIFISVMTDSVLRDTYNRIPSLWVECVKQMLRA